MKDYCDFETKQSLSCVNRRSRDLFRQCQLKDMEHYQFWRTEQRVFDVDLDKLAKCFVTFKKVHQFYSGEAMTTNNGVVIAGIVLVCFGGGISLLLLLLCAGMGGMKALCESCGS